MLNTLRDIRREDGWMGFAKGVGPRMMFHSMSAAISWTTYEYVKHALEQTFSPPSSAHSNNGPS